MNFPRHPWTEDIVRGGFSTPWDASTIPPFPVRARDSEVDCRAIAGCMDFAFRARPEAIGGRA